MEQFLITERRCKICMSDLRPEIDQLLLGDERREDGELYRYQDIVTWAADRDLNITEAGLSRHRTNHVQPAVMAAIESQKYMDAIAQATGRKLSVHSAVANVIASKTLRQLNDLEFSELNPERVLRVALRAAEVSLKLEQAERGLAAEVVERVDEKLKASGLQPETLEQIRTELYGLTG